MPHNSINSIIQTSDGFLWIVPLYDEDGFTDEFVNCLAQTSDGTSWAGTDGGGLVRIRGGKVIGKLGKKDGISDPFVSVTSVDRTGRQRSP